MFGSSPDIDSLITSEINSVGQSSDQSCKQVTISDVTCAACKQLFYRPVVLNCGHGMDLCLDSFVNNIFCLIRFTFIFSPFQKFKCSLLWVVHHHPK